VSLQRLVLFHPVEGTSVTTIVKRNQYLQYERTIYNF